MKMDQATAMAAAMLVTDAMLDISFPAPYEDRQKHSPVSSVRVVGWDNGKSRQLQPRNSPCQCGSGRKAKRCCVYFRRVEKESEVSDAIVRPAH